MSKAFVNDDAPAEEVIIPRRNLTGDAPNHITTQGFAAYKRELGELTAERAKTAAQNSPDREDKLRVIDLRLAVINGVLESANVIDPALQKGDRVLFGASVTVTDEDGKARVYKIVGVDETDAGKGKVSWISPIGKALLQAKVGDEVTLKTPLKNEVLEITKIEFKAIDD